MKKLYRTSIINIDSRDLIEVIPPDSDADWELVAITVKKKKIFYHWKADVEGKEMNFSTSDVDFQKTLAIVKNHSEQSLQESKSNVDDK